MSDTFLVSLERLLVLMVEQHPRLHPKMHYVCHVAVVKVYVAVSRHVTVFPDFLSRTGQYQSSADSWALYHCVYVINCMFYVLLRLPYGIGQTVIFLPVVSFYLCLFFPRLISAAADWMSTILRHMVWP